MLPKIHVATLLQWLTPTDMPHCLNAAASEAKERGEQATSGSWDPVLKPAWAGSKG